MDLPNPPRYVRAVRAWGWLVFVLVPSEAWAELFVPIVGDVPSVRRRSIVMSRDVATQATIQQWILSGGSSRFVHIQPFPTRPGWGPAPEGLWSALDEACAAEAPYHRDLNRRPLGPSVLSRLFPQPDQPAVASSERLEGAPASRIVREVFTGFAKSSTTTPGVFHLPDDIDRFFERYGARPEPEARRAIAFYLNRGFALLATVYETEGPPGPHRIGPERYTFVSNELTIPIYAPDSGEIVDFHTLGSQAWQPRDVPVDWSEEPWLHPEPTESAMLADCARTLDSDEARAQPLVRSLGPVFDRLTVVRYRWRPPRERYVSVRFRPEVHRPVPAQEAGTPRDYMLCFVLGLAPLFYAPESWLLWWAQSSVRGVLRRRLWAFWPIAVSAFWLSTLEGPGRIAGLAPLLLGLWWIARPLPEEDRPFVRSSFKKRKTVAD